MKELEKTMLEVLNLHFGYGGDFLLSGLDFSVKKGTFTGIIGPNGSGKTTLLKCLVKLLPPAAGKIVLDGKDLAKWTVREIARQVGFVPQRWETGFAFTAYDLVMMGRYPHQKRFSPENPKDRETVRKAMIATKTLHLAERPITEMSGGELQRVIIAQALAQSPDLLLLDEPTSHLDITHQIDLCELLKELNRDLGLTVICILHDLNLAAQYCDQLILLNKGKIYAAGDVEKVLTAHHIEEVYGVKAHIQHDPIVGRYFINFHADPPDSFKGINRCPARVHLIGGGGAAAELYRPLLSLGCRLSAGVLNIEDTDWVKAKEYGIPVVEEAPFSPVSEEKYRQNLSMMKEADLVILCNLPFGPGNVNNLLAAEKSLKMGKQLQICDFTPIAKRDFTGGTAGRIYAGLAASGAVIHSTKTELMKALFNH